MEEVMSAMASDVDSFTPTTNFIALHREGLSFSYLFPT